MNITKLKAKNQVTIPVDIKDLMVKEKALFGRYGSNKRDLAKNRKKYLKEILDEKHPSRQEPF